MCIINKVTEILGIGKIKQGLYSLIISSEYLE